MFGSQLFSLFWHVGYNAGDRHNRFHYQQLVSNQTGNQVSRRNHRQLFHRQHGRYTYWCRLLQRTRHQEFGSPKWYIPSEYQSSDRFSTLPRQLVPQHGCRIGIRSGRVEREFKNFNWRHLSGGDRFRQRTQLGQLGRHY
jgi:hypothetical protein